MVMVRLICIDFGQIEEEKIIMKEIIQIHECHEEVMYEEEVQMEHEWVEINV